MRSLHAIVDTLAGAADALSFESPVAFVYNPLSYAGQMTHAYVERCAHPDVPTLLLGMNPGPFGMVQTGVPFGEIAAVRDFVGIDEALGDLPEQHPKRPIEGFACHRSEVSGRRLWGWAKRRFGAIDSFSSQFFIWNYCPLAFLEAGGRNRTPDKLPAAERDELFRVCDDALRGLVEHLRPQRVVGVGAFAAKRATTILGDALPIGTVLHPSPASPAANRGWEAQAEAQLVAIGALSTAAAAQ